MKTIIFIIVLITSTCVVFAQDTSSKASTRVKPPKPASKVGVMVGEKWWQAPRDFGIIAFYNYTYDHNFFLQLSASYNTYEIWTRTEKYIDMDGSWDSPSKTVTSKEPDDYVATIGVNWWCYSDKIYIGLAGGINKPANEKLLPAFYLLAEVSFPIPKYNISIEANARGGITNYGINIGLAYLLSYSENKTRG